MCSHICQAAGVTKTENPVIVSRAVALMASTRPLVIRAGVTNQVISEELRNGATSQDRAITYITDTSREHFISAQLTQVSALMPNISAISAPLALVTFSIDLTSRTQSISFWWYVHLLTEFSKLAWGTVWVRREHRAVCLWVTIVLLTAFITADAVGTSYPGIATTMAHDRVPFSSMLDLRVGVIIFFIFRIFRTVF